MKKKTCFVIMGYGVKTDYQTQRTFNLDKTYFNIIKPAVTACGLECVRADEIKHSGTIDVPMFEHIQSSDVVIADLSTYNCNAFYELGVRHALKPFTTIVMAEKGFKYPFDVNHTMIMPYEHLEKDIGVTEAKRVQKELKDKIKAILARPAKDSPVYTYLSDLQPPQRHFTIGKARPQSRKKGEPIENNSKRTPILLSQTLGKGIKALNDSKFIKAVRYFEDALKISDDHFIVQKLALATYKSEKPTREKSLRNAVAILHPLSPGTSHDPETLGLAGAIHKRLWEVTGRRPYLNKAISFYEKGFNFKGDYYNGINYAYLLNVRAARSKNNNAIADYVLASRIRNKVIAICSKLLEKKFNQRGDQYWILATLEEAHYALGNYREFKRFSLLARKKSKAKWERDTTLSQINKLTKLLPNDSVCLPADR